MSDEVADMLPDEVRFHCQACNRSEKGTSEELDRYVKDDSQWPHCCGVRMAVVLGDGQVNSPERFHR